MNVIVMSKNRFTVNDKESNLEALTEVINKKWKIIENDDYKAFLNIGLSNTKDADYDFYLKVYKLLDAYKNTQKEELSQKKFGKQYVNLGQEEKQFINKHILINISEAELEDKWN